MHVLLCSHLFWLKVYSCVVVALFVFASALRLLLEAAELQISWVPVLREDRFRFPSPGVPFLDAMIAVWLEAKDFSRQRAGAQRMYSKAIREAFRESGILPEGFHGSMTCPDDEWAEQWSAVENKVVGVMLLRPSFVDDPMRVLTEQQKVVKLFWLGTK